MCHVGNSYQLNLNFQGDNYRLQWISSEIMRKHSRYTKINDSKNGIISSSNLTGEKNQLYNNYYLDTNSLKNIKYNSDEWINVEYFEYEIKLNKFLDGNNIDEFLKLFNVMPDEYKKIYDKRNPNNKDVIDGINIGIF